MQTLRSPLFRGVTINSPPRHRERREKTLKILHPLHPCGFTVGYVHTPADQSSTLNVQRSTSPPSTSPPSTLNLHPSTFTLQPSQPSPFTLHLSTFNRPNLQPSTFNVQHHNVQRYNLQRFSTFNRYNHRLGRSFIRTEPARLVVCQRIATIEGARMNPYAPRTIIKSALHPHR
jgi:hypothetical protein